MHLPQIAALTTVTEDLAEPGRAAQPSPEGEGFLSVFASDATGEAPQLPGSADEEMKRLASSSRARIAPTPATHGMKAVESQVYWAEAAGAEENAIGAALSRSVANLEPPEWGETPVGKDALLVAEEDAVADLPPEGAPAGELPSAAVAQASATAGAVQAAGMVPVRVAAGAQPVLAAEGDVQTSLSDNIGQDPTVRPGPIRMGADAENSVVAQDGPASRRGATALGTGADKVGPSPAASAAPSPAASAAPSPAPSTTPSPAASAAPSTTPSPAPSPVPSPVPSPAPSPTGSPTGSPAGSIAGGGLSGEPQLMTSDPGKRGPASLHGPVPGAGQVPAGGTNYPQGIAGNVATAAGPTDQTSPSALRLDDTRSAKAAGNGLPLPNAGTIGGPAGSQGPSAEPGSGREDARAAAEAPHPAARDVPKAENPTITSSATGTGAAAGAPGGLGADTGAAVLATGPGASGAGEGLFSADPAATDPVLGETRAAVRDSATATLPVFQSPQTPQKVALQIAEVVRASGERAVELRLQPEELGRVHLTMSQDATGALTVSLNVERAETLDLLRRNIDLLGADLQDLGYENIDFSFQGDGAGTEKDRRPERGDGPGAPGAETGETRATQPQTSARVADASGDGIDIRL